MADTSGGKDNRTVNRLGKTERIGRSGEQRAIARMRRCLILRQGASPLKPPAPFPALPLLGREETCQGSASPAKTRPPLTASLPSEETHSNGQGKGPLAMTFRAPPLGRRARRHKASGPPSREFFRLTEAGLLMEAATARKRCFSVRNNEFCNSVDARTTDDCSHSLSKRGIGGSAALVCPL